MMAKAAAVTERRILERGTKNQEWEREKDTIKIGTHIDLYEIGLNVFGNDFESFVENRYKNSVIGNFDSKNSDELKVNEFLE